MYSPIPEVAQDEDSEQQQEVLVTSSPVEQKLRSVLSILWRLFLLSFAVTCAIFGIFMTSVYLRSMMENQLHIWDLSLQGMYHPDRWDCNWLGMGIHFVGGTYMMLLGPLQFIPAIRNNPKWMPLHRWNGRFTALGSVLTAVGGMYYVGAVGVTTVRITGQQGNWTTIAFGLCMLICGCQTYRHAAWTKKIDQHKLWAYRVAGLCFGNIFFRIYLLAVFLCLDLDGMIAKFAIDVVGYIFFLPFVLLAGEVWKREQDEKAVPSITFVTASVFLLALFIVGATMVFLLTWLPFISIKGLDHNEDL